MAVNQEISRLIPAERTFYVDHILPILTEDPYPSAGFAPIEEIQPFDGRHFQYFDGIVPLVFQYVVYLFNGPRDEGMIWIWRAIRPDT